MKSIFTLFCALILLSSCESKKGLVRTGAFYEIAPKYVRNTAGKEIFVAYGKGLNEQECRLDAKRNLLRTLIYVGSREGTEIPPALNGTAATNAFKAEESTLLSNWAGNVNLIESNGAPLNRMKQSADENAIWSMSFEIGIDRNLLNTELVRFK